MLAAAVGGLVASVLAAPAPVMALGIAAGLHLLSAGLFAGSSVTFGGGDGSSTNAHPVLHDLKVGARTLLSTGRVRRAITTVCVHRFLLAAAVVVLALVADQRYDLPAAGYMAALLTVSIGTFAATVLTPKLRSLVRS